MVEDLVGVSESSRRMKTSLLAVLAAFSLQAGANAQIYITEFFYQGRPGSIGNEHEFVELSNIGTEAINLAGWAYTDSSAAVFFDLSGLGTVNPGQSVIFTDVSEANFRTIWSGLDAGVVVLGGAAPGLGRDDTIYIVDAELNIVDSLQYGDGDFPGSPRWRWTTGITTPDNLGADNIYGWSFSDQAVAWSVPMNNLTSINGDIGNPGSLNFGVVPEPGTYALLGFAMILVLLQLKRTGRLGNLVGTRGDS